MKPHADDRRDNVEKIQRNINHTIQNIERTEETMSLTDDPKQKQILAEKNHRREEALDSMRVEIRDEAMDKKRGYE
ncbi:small acid-soluble spore protein Tlp [Desulforamulus ruminis]|uniref:Protein Tlp homolog n=1 Tax=Desulforamulus ruminis (strain ATCC 23193 / DSM 2154 / NCIMB 8452 / DL) TaxID=696281 RepID=F6DR38_DESRL|nr:small acid-soluble spore protein Tlp [Desulforamulus ruminis]AEG59757.1 small, acid-soluble spore protein tlp [Desulforamulus ruminis DSM 2154]